MSLANLSKTASTLVNLIKQTIKSFLLKEDGDYLLLETGDKIILDGSDAITNLTKIAA